MKISYLTSNYVSHLKAGMGNIHCLKQAGALLTVNPKEADIVVIHDEPPTYPLHFERYPFLKSKYVIAYSVWETDILPDLYLDQLSCADEIWTSSHYTLNIFKNHFDNVYRVPHLVSRQNASKAALHHVGHLIDYKEDLFYFHTIVDGLNPRKNLKATLSAFNQIASQHGDRVRLVVKQYARMDESIRQLPNVISITQPFDDDAISALHQLCDVYVSSHCAEAWGLSISEALVQGKPVIATGFSGNMDYMNDMNSFPVAHTLRKLTDKEIAFQPELLTKQMSWAQIDTKDLYDKMLSCLVSNKIYDREKHSHDLLQQFGFEALTTILSSRLDQLFKNKDTRIQYKMTQTSRDNKSFNSENPLSRIGMFHQIPEDSPVTVGRQVAVDQFIHALVYHGSEYDYDLFCPPMHLPTIQNQVETDDRKVMVHDQHSLASTIDSFQFTAWHDNQLDTHRPFLLRNHAKIPYPVTILHHTLSYKELLHDKFLRLLLCQPHKYDSIICTSTSSKKALSVLLEYITEQFNAKYNTNLKYQGRFDIIPLTVDIDFYKPHARESARNSFKIPENSFVMLWVGRFSAIDKADLLPFIKMLFDLIQANPGQERLLLCNGRQRLGENFGDAVKDFATQLGISNNVRILDEVQDRMPLLYSAADVFVSPSDNLQESFGLTPIEAMACGVPQIVSDWNGYRDTVVHQETGFLIPTYTGHCSSSISNSAFLTESAFDHLTLSQSLVVDMAEMRNSIQNIIDNPDLQARMAKASRQRAVQEFSQEKIVSRYESLWSKLSLMADKAPEYTNMDNNYTRPPYHQAFSHYPTRHLPEKTQIGITPSGKKLITGEFGLPLYYNNHWKYLNVEIIKRIIDGAAKMDGKGQTLGIDRILSVITKDSNTYESREDVFRHVLWLLKYGFIECIDRSKTA